MTRALALSVGLAVLAAGCGSSPLVVRGPDQTSSGVQEIRLRSAQGGYRVLPVQSRADAIHVPLAKATCDLERSHEKFFLESEYTPEGGAQTRRVLLEHRVDHDLAPCSVPLAGIQASLHIDGLEPRWTATTLSGLASFTVPDDVLLKSKATRATFRTREGQWRVDLRNAKALAAARVERRGGL
jgi:hypothetical protein